MVKKAFIAMPVLLFLLDQYFKLLVLKGFSTNTCPGIRMLMNKGIAFGIANNSIIMNYAMIIIYILLLIGLLFFYNKYNKWMGIYNYGIALLFVGISSNLVDRLIHGAVIDYIDLCIWPVFNLADLSIVIGITLLIVFIAKKNF
ncbi:signal peptidase II [Candidatus Woesearchaeota archaeon]|nr:signal peptidase II [Candidatus Woesearchaeota archaeon]